MIDIEKFICSLLADHPAGVTVRGDIHKALKDQGLEYKGGKIVSIEDKISLPESEDERIRKYLTSFVELNSGVNLPPEDAKKILGWIDKQGEQKPAWKPSGEQMKYLRKYAEQNNYDGRVLTSLFNDLKKLREV